MYLVGIMPVGVKLRMNLLFVVTDPHTIAAIDMPSHHLTRIPESSTPRILT